MERPILDKLLSDVSGFYESDSTRLAAATEAFNRTSIYSDPAWTTKGKDSSAAIR